MVDSGLWDRCTDYANRVRIQQGCHETNLVHTNDMGLQVYLSRMLLRPLSQR